MEINPIFELAEKFVNQTDKNIFVTGKAGTGKTTFLKHIVNTTFKKCVVAAPTGIAAINAGGVTLHSLLQLPLLPFLPTNEYFDQNIAFTKKTLLAQQRMSRKRVKLLNEIELLIIDEASMLRADMLDCIDFILKARRKNNNPFGGLQVLFIGDLYQLPPVVKREEEAMMRKYYANNYFFNAQVMAEVPPICVELNKIYRQLDEEFVALLNEVRNGRISTYYLETLNKRFNPIFEPEKVGEYITICSHNFKADEINQQQLAKLQTPLKIFEAEKNGEFFAEPVDPILKLKEGAQIIFIKNDKNLEKRYYNGKLAIVQSINDDGITVKFPEDENLLTIEKETWENKRVDFNTELDEIEEKILGTYKQFPIKLAWAITIHKSQGLTFDKAIIDAGSSFATGQVYVALSRMRTIEGMILKSEINHEAIMSDPLINSFTSTFENEKQLKEVLEAAQKEYFPTLLYKAFDFEKVIESFYYHRETLFGRKFDGMTSALELTNGWLENLEKLSAFSGKFILQLQAIITGGNEVDFVVLNDRVSKAVIFFTENTNATSTQVQSHRKEYIVKKNTKAYSKELNILVLVLQKLIDRFKKAALLCKIMAGETGLFNEYVNTQKTVTSLENKAGSKEEKIDKDSKLITFELYQEHKSVAKVIDLRGFSEGTIYSHLSFYVANGVLPVKELIENEKLLLILQKLENIKATRATKEIKEMFDEAISYNDINLVMAHKTHFQNTK